ncbi:MAG: DNA translocase FtsK [Candidatus Izimaplasma sp.]|nr:DNA translocase FtsK [Candidatus Izimaplasma bacterium]
MFWPFKSKKRKLIVEERTEDSKPFEIPQIAEENIRKPYANEGFVSPIFGRNVKDDVVIPTPHKREGDIDKQLDTFRTKPRLTKEEMKKKYGSEYPEFDLVHGKNLDEAMASQNRHKHDPITEEDVKQESENRERFKKQKDDDQELNSFFKKSFQKEMHRQENETKTVESKPFKIKRQTDESTDTSNTHTQKSSKKPYKLPSVSLLTRNEKQTDDNPEWVQNQIEVLNSTLSDFGVDGEVETFTKGPTVTRYEIVLESGVNVKKVTSISDNIKMNLAAKEIRIEAPIPGKSTVGVEVPNEVPEIVQFVDIVDTNRFRDLSNPLTIAIGQDIDGKNIYSSITKMPHGLIAGATNSGKSVCINTLLMSLLYKHTPEELRLMLIDPKFVELNAYNNLPHLITPVITEAKIATAGLKWAVEEMERRFLLFQQESTRDISSFNKKMKQNDEDILPYIVIVIDELSELMQVSGSTVEESIMRLTQKARAAGLHLMIATQRPSTDVIKGTIKSNIPTRFAFMVSSYVDSMTIIDSAGADKLLGRGDMLFQESGKPKHRVQGAFISDEEIDNVVTFINNQQEPDFLFGNEELIKEATKKENTDELTDDVARYVVEEGKASINAISKEFHIGFNRAQNIVETLFEMDIVSENVGSKARDVLVDLSSLEKLLGER